VGLAVSSAWQQLSAKRPEPMPDYTPQFTIQSGHGGHAPLFCVPGAGGNITAFAALATALGPAWPVHGLQPRGLAAGQVPHGSVQAAAACYMQALLAQCPSGRCHLLGHSFGGWVVYEMAAQLRAAGLAPLSVTLVDTEAPTGDVVHDYTRIDALMTLVELVELGLPAPLELGRDDFARLDAPGQLALLHERMVAAHVMPSRSTPLDLNGVFRTLSMNLRTAYTPSVVSEDPVHLVLVHDTRLTEQACTLQHQATVEQWQRWAPLLRPRAGPGNHLTILRPPHVAALASQLRAVWAVAPVQRQ
jgi:arthrofactin-type cyclic lipopeptide synthetase C